MTGHPVYASGQYFAELLDCIRVIIVSTLKTEYAGIPVCARPADDFHALRMIDSQQNMAVGAGGFHFVRLVDHIPIANAGGDGMAAVSDMHVDFVTYGEAKAAIMNPTEICEFLPFWEGQDGVVEYDQSLSIVRQT